jgi:hypothetical protein
MLRHCRCRARTWSALMSFLEPLPPMVVRGHELICTQRMAGAGLRLPDHVSSRQSNRPGRRTVRSRLCREQPSLVRTHRCQWPPAHPRSSGPSNPRAEYQSHPPRDHMASKSAITPAASTSAASPSDPSSAANGAARVCDPASLHLQADPRVDPRDLPASGTDAPPHDRAARPRA